MSIIEFLVSLISFFLLNIPVYAALNKYILKPGGRVIGIIVTVVFWGSALFAQNLPAFIGVVLLIFTVYSRRTDEETYIRDRGVWEFHPSDVGFVVLVTLLFRVVIGAVNFIYVYILDWLTKYQAKPQEIVTDFTSAGWIYKAILFFVIVIFAPVVEEYAFRYYLYDKKLLPRMPAAVAAVISAAVFSTIHYNLGGVPSFFGLGLLNCYIYEKKGYYGAVIAHLVFNLTSVMLLLLG